MKTRIAILILGTSLALSAQQPTSLFSDHKSFSVGDVITVQIVESTSASAEANSETDRSFNHGVSSTAGQGPFSFIPLSGFSAEATNKAKGDAKTSRGSKLSGTMTARIAAIDSNGNLIIQGSRMVEINGEQELTSLEGTVRAQDIQADNTVLSSYIAEAKITYKGKGAVKDGAKIGFLSRVVNFLF
jgi:flagellar L-ring protein precursor FlgH